MNLKADRGSPPQRLTVRMHVMWGKGLVVDAESTRRRTTPMSRSISTACQVLSVTGRDKSLKTNHLTRSELGTNRHGCASR